MMMEAARTSETSVDNYFTRQYIPEDNSELVVLSFQWKELRHNLLYTFCIVYVLYDVINCNHFNRHHNPLFAT
jgi:hypothetical protein